MFFSKLVLEPNVWILKSKVTIWAGLFRYPPSPVLTLRILAKHLKTKIHKSILVFDTIGGDPHVNSTICEKLSLRARAFARKKKSLAESSTLQTVISATKIVHSLI